MVAVTGANIQLLTAMYRKLLPMASTVARHHLHGCSGHKQTLAFTPYGIPIGPDSECTV